MRIPIRRLAPTPILAVLVTAACAGSPEPGTVDPVVVTQARLEELAEAHPLDRCAARAVLEERALAAERLGRDRDRPRNLTRSSADATQSFQIYQEARSSGSLENRDRQLARRAMRSFDAAMDEAEAAAPRAGERRVGALDARMAAHYARAWQEYFELLHQGGDRNDAARDQLLDWLTTRSMIRQDLLDAYYEDFLEVMEEGCAS